MRMTTITAAFFVATTANAQGITVEFIEGAPKDSFRLTNAACALTDATVSIDLSATPAGLIFDVTGSGAGVEVFQPVEITSGSVTVRPVSDGDQMMELLIADFPTDTRISLTTDLDDTVSDRQITVNGSEMSGATVTIATGGMSQTAAFDSDSTAFVAMGQDCPAS